MSGRPPAQGSFGLDGRLSAEAQARPSSTMGVLLAVLAIAGVASAQSTETSTTAWPIAVPPWLFNQDSRVPAAMQVVSSSRLAFAAAGGEGWPVARLPLSTGAAVETVTELGVGGSVSLQALGSARRRGRGCERRAFGDALGSRRVALDTIGRLRRPGAAAHPHRRRLGDVRAGAVGRDAGGCRRP